MSKIFLRGVPIAIILALVLNLVIYYAGLQAGATYETTQQPVNVINVIAVSVVTAIGGALLLWVLARFTDNPLRVFLWIAAIFSLISLLGPYTMTKGSANFVSLGLMHVASTLAILYGLTLYPFHREEELS